MLRASTPSHSRWRTPPATRSSAAQTAAPPVSAAAVCQSWPRLGWAGTRRSALAGTLRLALC